MKKLFLFALSLIILNVACDDNSSNPTPTPENPPEITKIEPTTVKKGEPLRIFGKYFGNERADSYVSFSGQKVSDNNYSLWADTVIVIIVPENATSGAIKVSVGGKVSNEVNVNVQTVSGEPFISVINPDKARPGEEFLIQGINFGDTQGSSFINFFNSKLDNKYIKSWTNSKISVNVPEGYSSGKGKVSVVVGGVSSNEVDFTILENSNPIDTPVIDYLKPDRGMAGDTITIYGRKFTDFRKSHNGFVVIGGVNVKDPEGYVDWKDQHIVVIIPEGAKTGKLYVSRDGVKSNEVDFYYEQYISKEPKITSLSNSFGKPNQEISIFGKNFGPQQGNSKVYIGSYELSSQYVLMWSDNEIKFKVPSDISPGIYELYIMVNGVKSNVKDFTVIEENNPKPKICEMVEIKAGNFEMGGQNEAYSSLPIHTVTITYDFYMSKYEITQAQWKKASDTYPNYLPDDVGDNKPATQLDWFTIVKWCNAASERDGFEPCYTINGEEVTCDFTKNGYRLPTEAEWEYACRAGTSGDYYFTNTLDDNAWYSSNSGKHLNEVGKKQANQWGLYDIYGNAAEWCWDWFSEYSENSEIDPRGPNSGDGNGKIIRGGSAQSSEASVNSWYRMDLSPVMRERMVGFRVVRKK